MRAQPNACANTAQNEVFASVFILTSKQHFKLVSSVGDAVKNDIIVSRGLGGLVCALLFLCFSSSFFSLRVRAVLSGKIKSDPFHKFIVSPLSQRWKVQ